MAELGDEGRDVAELGDAAEPSERRNDVVAEAFVRDKSGIAGTAPDQVGPLRVEEERRSAAVVGVTEVEFLDHADGLVEYGIALRRDLAAAFRRLQPQVVIGMSFDLTWGEEGPVNHADHRAVGLATLDACRDAANEWVFPEAGPRATDIRALLRATAFWTCSSPTISLTNERRNGLSNASVQPPTRAAA